MSLKNRIIKVEASMSRDIADDPGWAQVHALLKKIRTPAAEALREQIEAIVQTIADRAGVELIDLSQPTPKGEDGYVRALDALAQRRKVLAEHGTALERVFVEQLENRISETMGGTVTPCPGAGEQPEGGEWPCS
jgi:hypothetical protein